MKIKNKRVWITGASSGIGAAMARQLSGVASLLLLSGLNVKNLKALQKSIANENTIIEVIPFNLDDPNEVEEVARKVLTKYGCIDILINNGGISQRSLSLETTTQVNRNIMEINFFSQVLMAKILLPEMIKQGEGHIAVTSSMVGKFGFPLRSSYSASKHAVQGYFETVGLEYYRQGIRVTIASPGRIKTNISLNAVLGNGEKYGEMDPGQASGMSAEKCAKKYIRAIEKNKWEVYIGKSEILMIWFKRFIPSLYRRLALKVDTV